MTTTFSRGWFLAGLFLTTLVTLCIEVLYTRLLSVILWYHLSFFAVSTAMFGMSAGALQVYLSAKSFEGRPTLRALSRLGVLFALSVPLSHLIPLVILVPSKQATVSTMTLAALVVMTIAVAVPFFLSGMLVAIALTRVPGRIGLTYAVDLIGAALGTLLVIPLLDGSNISSAFFLCGTLAAAGALCFRLSAGSRFSPATALAALAMAGIAFANERASDPLRVWLPKGSLIPLQEETEEFWNIHSQVTLSRDLKDVPHFWGAGKGASAFRAQTMGMAIDGLAGTVMTKWDGELGSLEWSEYDVTALPYHLRAGGDAAVIGVGGGRDILTALRFGCRSVRGIEINDILLDLLRGPLRDFTRLAGRADVTLVHDEARSYLTRTEDRFDVLQMSLIDTWASTGAGAMTLTENGLYTREAWEVFLRVLKPGGIFGVSRWYDPESVSETSRLVSLAASALLARGVATPAEHLALVARNRAATLVLSTSPLSPQDVQRIRATAERFEFKIVFAPGSPAADPQLASIVSSGSEGALARATEHELYDFSPPTDERPFFFNQLKLGGALKTRSWAQSLGVVSGNLRATTTLAVLFAVSALLVAGVILVPLLASGMPRMDAQSFALSLWYFAAIGLGYMLVQIPSMQRFSVYLGHPVYAVVVILFSMILATGIGSWFSDRMSVDSSPRLVRVLPLAMGAAILAFTSVIQPLIEATIGFGLLARALVVVALVAPVAFLLGFGFPLGLRLVRRISPAALPWMWGVNGACGVFAAVLSVAVSMTWGIHANLYAATALYGSLVLAAPVLWRRGELRPGHLDPPAEVTIPDRRTVTLTE